MDSYVYGLNSSSESILIMSYFYFSGNEHVTVEFWYNFIMFIAQK